MKTFLILTYHIMFRVDPAAHAKPHAQQQIARDLEVGYETFLPMSQGHPINMVYSRDLEVGYETFLPMSQGHPINMVYSRSGVRVYAATPRSGPCLLCAAARFVPAMTT